MVDLSLFIVFLVISVREVGEFVGDDDSGSGVVDARFVCL